MKQKLDLNSIILIISFLAYYFYLDDRSVDVWIKIPSCGLFIGMFAFVLYGLKIANWFKYTILLLITVLMCFLPVLVMENRRDEKITDNRFSGSWITDTTGGYAISLRIEADSAYLSHSNAPLSRAYRLALENDTFTLANEEMARVYKWSYKFSKNDDELQLYNLQDTLLLKRIRFKENGKERR